MSLKVSALLNPAPSSERTPAICEQLHSLLNTDHAVAFGTQTQEGGHKAHAYADECPLVPQVSLPSNTLREQYNLPSGYHNELVAEYELPEDLQLGTTLIPQPIEVSLT